MYLRTCLQKIGVRCHNSLKKWDGLPWGALCDGGGVSYELVEEAYKNIMDMFSCVVGGGVMCFLFPGVRTGLG